MLPEPGGDSADTGQVAAAVAVELGEPTGQLVGQVVTGAGQIAQPTRLPVHGMDRRQGIDELVERRSVRLRCSSPAGRHGGADGRSGNALHDVEGCLEDVDVAARQNGSGDADGLVLDGVEDTELTEHIVGRWPSWHGGELFAAPSGTDRGRGRTPRTSHHP